MTATAPTPRGWLIDTNVVSDQPDALLAATALVHDLGVATRNTADFDRAEVWLLNPWQQPL